MPSRFQSFCPGNCNGKATSSGASSLVEANLHQLSYLMRSSFRVHYRLAKDWLLFLIFNTVEFRVTKATVWICFAWLSGGSAECKDPATGRGAKASDFMSIAQPKSMQVKPCSELRRLLAQAESTATWFSGRFHGRKVVAEALGALAPPACRKLGCRPVLLRATNWWELEL